MGDRKFKAGDIVKITEWGYQYQSNIDWFYKHIVDGGFEVKWAIRYAYGNPMFLVEGLGNRAKLDSYRVYYASSEQDKYLISVDNDCAPMYLFSARGLKPAPRAMTQDDIESELGYEVELIGEWKNA